MRAIDKVDRLHARILEEIGQESPETAERILRRFDTIAAEWAG
jgi:hypothetical protein